MSRESGAAVDARLHQVPHLALDICRERPPVRQESRLGHRAHKAVAARLRNIKGLQPPRVVFNYFSGCRFVIELVVSIIKRSNV